jgi:pimeloyl-ACP methyl ester carboxylesterase
MLLTLTLAITLIDAPPPRLVGEFVELNTDTGTLHATLDLPAIPGPWPVVLIHAGSGPTNRDGNGPLTRSDNLKMVGRALADQGFAVLRIDKRGIGASAKAITREEDLRLETYADDVVAWGQRLRRDPRFTKVGYIGHSEGALIGLIAQKAAQFDAVVLLCGPGRPLQDVLRDQLKKNLPADLYKESETIISALVAGNTVPNPPKTLAALFRPSVQPYLISSFQYDPARLIAEITRPVLVVSGSTDIQVGAVDAKRLGEANPKATVVTIKGMNHVLKAVEGMHQLLQLPSYNDPSLPLHPKLVPTLSDFFRQSLGRK